jgi:hypothetical protein
MFGTAYRSFSDALEIQTLLGPFIAKQYIDSASIILPPMTIRQVKGKKMKNGIEIHKIEVLFYYMTYNSAGVAQFAW